MDAKTVRIFLFGALGAIVALYLRDVVVEGHDWWSTLGLILMTAVIAVGLILTKRAQRKPSGPHRANNT